MENIHDSHYTLYMHPIQDDTKILVRYCNHKGYIIQPETCIERHQGLSEEQLPAIYDKVTNIWYYGHAGCVKYYEQVTGLHDIWHRAKAFAKRHPDYRINK